VSKPIGWVKKLIRTSEKGSAKVSLSAFAATPYFFSLALGQTMGQHNTMKYFEQAPCLGLFTVARG